MEDSEIGLLRSFTLPLAIVEFFIVVIEVVTMVQVNSHSYSRNIGELVDVDERGGYRYNRIHSSSHNPGGRVIFLVISCSSFPVVKHVHGNEIAGYSGHVGERGDITGDDGDKRVDISGDDGRYVFRYP